MSVKSPVNMEISNGIKGGRQNKYVAKAGNAHDGTWHPVQIKHFVKIVLPQPHHNLSRTM